MLSIITTHTKNKDDSNNNTGPGRKFWEVIDMSTALKLKFHGYELILNSPSCIH